MKVGGKSGGKKGELGGLQGTWVTFRISNLLIPFTPSRSSNPSLSDRFPNRINVKTFSGGKSGGKSRFSELTTTWSINELAWRRVLRKPHIPLFV